MTNFHRALLDELRSRVDEPPAGPRPVRLAWPWPAVGAATAVAAVAAVAAIVVHKGQAPAYAVTNEADGSVSVAVHRIGDAAEANRRLDDASGRVIIIVPSEPHDCPVSDRGTVAAGGITNYILMPRPNDNVARVYPFRLPPNTVVVVIPFARDPGGPPTAAAIPYLAPGPKCVLDPSR